MAVVDGKIRCSVCGESKPTTEYAPSHVHRGSGPCRPCKAARSKAWRESHPYEEAARHAKYRAANASSVREGHAKYRKAHRRKKREQALRAAYGIGLADYERMRGEQGGRCASCGDSSARLMVDHDHSTGAVRGLLCHGCNAGLGLFRDDADRLAAAIQYLARQRVEHREAA